MNNGFIKWYRKILDWQWYTDIPTHILFEHLILTANWKDKKWRNIVVRKGQKVTSIQHLADETGLSLQQVRTALCKLKSSGDITSKATNKNTLITIANYDLYQFEMEDITSKTTNEQQTNNKQITNKQQTNNKQITTTKEYKEYKEYKNNNIKEKYKKEKADQKIHFAEFVSMTNVEYEKLINTYGEQTTNQCIEVLDNYKGSSGKKYKSDYRAILSWVIDRVNQTKPRKSDTNTSWKDLIDKVWEETNK